LKHPQTETDWGNVNPNGIRACYDEGKRALEALLMDYHRQHALDVRIIRVFNTYGPRMQSNDGRAMPTFIRQALAGEKLTIQGTGDQTRSFCYVSDLIAGILAMAQSDTASGEVVNIGNPREITILDLCNTIGAIVPIAGLTFVPAAQDDPTRRCPNIDKARSLLGWEPKVGLHEGLSVLMAKDSPQNQAS
jgi:nucleoside-diphosphate-sugar epimerase